MDGITCHECGPTWGTLWLDVILLQHDALLRKAGHRWGLQHFVFKTLGGVREGLGVS